MTAPWEETVLRCAAILLAALVVAAGPADAQSAAAKSDAEFRLSPIVGFAPGFTRTDQREVFFDGQLRAGRFETQFSGGNVGGAALEVRWIEPFRVSTAAVVVSRASTAETALQTREVSDGPGELFIMARAGLAVRVFEANPDEQIYPVNLAVFFAPAYVLEIPDRDGLTGVRHGPLGSPGVSFGAEGELPLGERLGVHFAVEDWVAFWNRDGLERRTTAELVAAGLDVRSIVYPAASHMWLLRTGFSVRF